MKRRILSAFIIPAFLLTVNNAFCEDLKGFVLKEINNGISDSKEKIELGKMLFFDRRLSGDGTLSCASCHNPSEGFSDGQKVSFSYPTTKNFRNTPTLYNIKFSTSFFWDGRVSSLEKQALFPIQSPFEMNQNINFLVEKLNAVLEYKELFYKAFKEGITAGNIGKALVAFEKTIVINNSVFDRYVKGDRKALNEKAKKGFDLFIGKAGCVRCHLGPNLSDYRFHATGVPEPSYLNEPERIVSKKFFLKSVGFKNYENVKEDLGRYFITGKKEDYKAFKTPTLRNITKTAPYMHNGAFATLMEVIEFYNKGGGDIIEKDKTLKPLNLSKEEKESLVEFLKSLTAEFRVKMPHIP